MSSYRNTKKLKTYEKFPPIKILSYWIYFAWFKVNVFNLTERNIKLPLSEPLYKLQTWFVDVQFSQLLLPSLPYCHSDTSQTKRWKLSCSRLLVQCNGKCGELSPQMIIPLQCLFGHHTGCATICLFLTLTVPVISLQKIFSQEYFCIIINTILSFSTLILV